MKSVESPYVVANRWLTEYEKAVKFKPGSAYRKAKKGYRAAVTEAEAARTHLKAEEILTAQKRMEERKIKDLDSAYRSSLAKGNMGKAVRLSRRLYAEASKNPDPSPVVVGIDDNDIKDGRVRFFVTNRSDRPMVVDSISCTSGTDELMSEKEMSQALQAGDQIVRDVAFNGDPSLGITVFVEYEDRFELVKIRRQFSLMRQV